MSALFGDPRLPERFWAKAAVDDATGCWLWTAGKNSDGYGTFFDGRQRGAHRVAYETLVGPIPEGLVLDHVACDTPRCVNPGHLSPVTQGQNTLRSLVAIAALNARKTHCPQGHAYEGDNLIVARSGKRFCRACAKARPYRPRRSAA